MSFIQSLARPAFFSQNESQRQKFIGRLVPSVMCVITRSTWSRNSAMAPRVCFFFLFFFSLFGLLGLGVQGLRLSFSFYFFVLWEVSVLFCLVFVGLCSITSDRAKSRAQALVIRSHNSVVVDIRRITCISPFTPDSPRFTFFTCFLSLKRRARKTYPTIFNFSFALQFFLPSTSTNW